MLVERAIRPFTVHRKNSLFYSSEEGVETALAFFTLIETCKNAGPMPVTISQLQLGF